MDRLGILGPKVTLTHAISCAVTPTWAMERWTATSRCSPTAARTSRTARLVSRRGEVLRSWERYRRAGINLALGTDTAPADILGEMRMAASLAKVVDEDPLAGSAASVFFAATVGGARALGRDDLGRLAPGTKADVSVFDLRSLQLGVIDCPIKALVHYASGADAEHVFVDGAWVVKDRDVVAIDDGAILDEAQAAWGDYKVGLAARDPRGRSAAEMYPTAYPVRRR